MILIWVWVLDLDLGFESKFCLGLWDFDFVFGFPMFPLWFLMSVLFLNLGLFWDLDSGFWMLIWVFDVSSLAWDVGFVFELGFCLGALICSHAVHSRWSAA